MRFKMKSRWSVSLAIVLFGLGLSACGGAGRGASPSASLSSHGESAGSGSSEPAAYEGYGPKDEADEQKVAAIVERYYAAAAADDGAKACSMLYSHMANSVAEDYGQPPGPPELRGKTCAVVMSKVFKHRDGQPTADLTAITVIGMRTNKDNEALALLRSPAMAFGEISLHRQGSSWKILQLLGSPLQ